MNLIPENKNYDFIYLFENNEWFVWIKNITEWEYFTIEGVEQTDNFDLLKKYIVEME